MRCVKAEQRSREVFENSSDSISLIDVTDGRLRFRGDEPRGERLSGWKSIEARGKYLEEVLPRMSRSNRPHLSRVRRNRYGCELSTWKPIPQRTSLV